MTSALFFLMRFTAVAGLLYGVWPVLAPVYLATVTPVVNGICDLAHLPVQLEVRGQALVVVYALGGTVLRLEAQQYQAACLNLIAALALVTATPSRSPGWRLQWAAGVVGILWLTHVIGFLAETQIAVWRYLDGLPAGPDRGALAQAAQAHLARGWAELVAQAASRWNLWGRYAVPLALWFASVRGEVAAWSAGVNPAQAPAAGLARPATRSTVRPRPGPRRLAGEAPEFTVVAGT